MKLARLLECLLIVSGNYGRHNKFFGNVRVNHELVILSLHNSYEVRKVDWVMPNALSNVEYYLPWAILLAVVFVDKRNMY